MRRKIPSTTALISFEAAARHESFTKAAEELSSPRAPFADRSPALRSSSVWSFSGARDVE